MSSPGTIYWFRIAAALLVRSGRVSLVLSVMVVASVAVMIVLAAMSVGINDAMTRNSVSLYSGHVCGAGIPLSVPPSAFDGPEVKAVLRRVEIPGILQGRAGVASLLLVAVDPGGEQLFTALPAKTVSGRYLSPNSRTVFISTVTAQTLGVSEGDVVRYRPDLETTPVELVVSGIFHTGFEKLDHGCAFFPYGAVIVPETCWSTAIFLKDGVDADGVAADMNTRIQSPGLLKSWMEIMPDLKELVELNYVSMGVVLVLVFSVVSLGVGCAYVIFIFKNVREYGIMMTMGMTHNEITWLIFLQIMIMSIVASAIGLAVGVLASVLLSKHGLDLSTFTSHNRYFTVSAIIRPRLTDFSLLLPPGLALVSGLMASLWPAIMVRRQRPADLMRFL